MESDSTPLTYWFDTDHDLSAEELTTLLGGKGAGLVEMTRLGMPVPPGFTITTEACRRYLDHGWDDELDERVRAGVAELERRVGRALGEGDPPLLVSVRSGAAVSMPGMMQTVLGVGGGAPAGGSRVDSVVAAVQSVFESWNADEAEHYRRVEHIAGLAGTAATVQAMVFGDLDDRSASGVAFSRDPSTGSPGLMGDFLLGAPGEDVVAGRRRTDRLARLHDLWPEVWEQLADLVSRLEHHFVDMVDVEFTVESGQLWLLQVRRGKRSPRAALRVAIDLAEDDSFPLGRDEAIRRCAHVLADPPRVEAGSLDDVTVIATGLAASPGLAAGLLCTEIDDALDLDAAGQRVILVRPTTSPADVRGMSVSSGLVTLRGGLVSHAAVVARSWGIPCVVGAEQLQIEGDGVVGPGGAVARGMPVTVDGSGGRLLAGDHVMSLAPAPEVELIERWIAEADDER